MLDKKMYYDANVEHLGVKLRRFQAWFSDYQSDSVKVESNRKLKVKPERKQNKVVFQAARVRFTVEQKWDLIQQYDKAKAANGALTIKEFCSTKRTLHHKTFTPWLRPMERKRIEIDVRNPQSE